MASEPAVILEVQTQERLIAEHSFSLGIPIWLGRDPSCNVPLPDPSVSRRHCRIESDQHGLHVSDASANGTIVEGQLIKGTTLSLRSVATMRIGPYDIRATLAAEQPPRAQEATTDTPIATALDSLEALFADHSVSDIMVVDSSTIFIERAGKMYRSGLRFTDDAALHALIERMIAPLGLCIDASTPLIDARLLDGSQLHAVFPPLAPRGPSLTIRKGNTRSTTLTDLIGFGALSQPMAHFLERAVHSRKNILITGGVGSGKTSLLNALAQTIPERERIVTIEEAAQLKLAQAHVVSLVSRPGPAAYTIHDLVKNALRIRPDRLLVDECGGGEALDLFRAMEISHAGSLLTLGAMNPAHALARCEALCRAAGSDMSPRAIRRQISAGTPLIVQLLRFSDGARRISNISEVVCEEGELEAREIFSFVRTGTDASGNIVGEHRANHSV